MTREEVIKALDICTNNDEVVACSSRNCPYSGNDDCVRDLMKDALVQIETDRDKALESKAEKVVEYKILNREDFPTAFHDYVFKCADEYFNWTGADEQVAHTRLSAICGAAVLMNNILNPRKEESNAD